MTGLEKIKYKNTVIAFIVRDNIDIKEGINFFTTPLDPLQLALHSYKAQKITKIHHNKISSPISQTQKYKYIYMIRGAAKIELSIETGKVVKSVELKRGDSIIIMDIYHKVIFAPKSRIIEIKQGPYDKNNE